MEKDIEKEIIVIFSSKPSSSDEAEVIMAMSGRYTRYLLYVSVPEDEEL